MSFSSVIASYENSCGSRLFEFRQNDNLASKNNFPHDYGVYLIMDGISKRVLYIGKSGTLSNGYDCDSGERKGKSLRFGKQTLQERIQAKHSKTETREHFYKRVMDREKLAKLIFVCFVTTSRETHQGAKYPFEAEAEMLAAYIRKFGVLPDWNKTA